MRAAAVLPRSVLLQLLQPRAAPKTQGLLLLPPQLLLLLLTALALLACAPTCRVGAANSVRPHVCPPAATALLNPLALTTRDSVDFLPAGEAPPSQLAAAALDEAVSWVKVQMQSAVGNITATAATAASTTEGNAALAALHPHFSCNQWLQVTRVERAGVGHTLAAVGFYLRAAGWLSLTLHSPFYSAVRAICILAYICIPISACLSLLSIYLHLCLVLYCCGFR